MRRQASGYWTIPREWEGETAFIVAGGPSASQQNLELLRGRKVIAVKKSFMDVPWADYCFGMDGYFYDAYREQLLRFQGRVVTTVQAKQFPGLLKLRQASAPGHDDQQAVYCGCTSLSGAMDLARQLGAKRIVLLGADGQDTPEARKYHSKRNPTRPHRDARYRDWKQVLQRLVKSLHGRGVDVLNASPGSAYHDFIPEVDINHILKGTMTIPFNPNDFHDDMVGPQSSAPAVTPGLAAAMDAARVSLAKSDAKGKDAVKLASVHLRTLLQAAP